MEIDWDNADEWDLLAKKNKNVRHTDNLEYQRERDYQELQGIRHYGH